MTQTLQSQWISGFWRRVGAFVFDSLLLGIVGLFLGLFFERTFVEMGAWGRLVGFIIALIYFGLMNSRICGGQTIGKKLLNIRVVDANNATLSLDKSVLRYLVIATPFSLNGAPFSNQFMSSFFVYPLSIIVFGGILSLFYLYIFNRLTRQSLHDLAVGSFVVNSNAAQQETQAVWRTHITVVTILLIVAALVPIFTANLVKNEPFKGLLTTQQALSQEPNVTHATLFVSSSTFTSSTEGTSSAAYIRAQVFLNVNHLNDADLANQLAATIVRNYPQALDKDSLQITLTYGYSIGIAQKWLNQTYRFNASEIQALNQQI